MIAYIEGKLVKKNPSYVIIDCGGIGYLLHISLYTYSNLKETENCRLYTYQIIREDAHLLYGFIHEQERELFKHLISVSGVGAATARMILSSLSPDQIHSAILNNDLHSLKSVKGVGPKTAQRIIVDLKDKLEKLPAISEISIPTSMDNIIKKEALSALVMLGFPKNESEKIINHIINTRGADLSVEELVKIALKEM